MDIRPVIVVLHAAFAPERRPMLDRVIAQLRVEAPKIPFLIEEDYEAKGSTPVWVKAIKRGVEMGATHVVCLPDDVVLCKDFGSILTALIETRPNDVFDCLVNHMHQALDSMTPPPALWYSTNDGFIGHGGTMPAKLVTEHLAWRQKNKLPDDFGGDAGVNLWAMDTGRLIYKPVFSLVKHDISVRSLDGHDDQPVHMREGRNFIDQFRTGIWEDLPNFLARTYRANESDAPGVRGSCIHLGRTYQHNHLALIETLVPARVERYFDADREHGIPADRFHVFIAAPAYRGEVKSDWVLSLMAEMDILRRSGVDVSLCFKADSLINRARNRLVTDFLKSDATHMLMWDTDNFPVPEHAGAVKKLLETGHDVVGGAIVLKDGKGNKFAMRFGGEGYMELTAVNDCIPVDMIGTAFLMVSRKAIIKLIRAMPETYYRAGRWMDDSGRPEWHLFADAVRDKDHLSEDFEFCKRWKDIGGELYIHPDLEFIHYGDYPFTGSFSKTFFREHNDAAAKGTVA